MSSVSCLDGSSLSDSSLTFSNTLLPSLLITFPRVCWSFLEVLVACVTYTLCRASLLTSLFLNSAKEGASGLSPQCVQTLAMWVVTALTATKFLLAVTIVAVLVSCPPDTDYGESIVEWIPSNDSPLFQYREHAWIDILILTCGCNENCDVPCSWVTRQCV